MQWAGARCQTRSVWWQNRTLSVRLLLVRTRNGRPFCRLERRSPISGAIQSKNNRSRRLRRHSYSPPMTFENSGLPIVLILRRLVHDPCPTLREPSGKRDGNTNTARARPTEVHPRSASPKHFRPETTWSTHRSSQPRSDLFVRQVPPRTPPATRATRTTRRIRPWRKGIGPNR